MKKKWLCFALFLCLLIWPFTPLSRLEAQDKLARALSAAAPRESASALTHWGREILQPGGGLAALRCILDRGSFRRGLTATPRARQAAGTLVDWALRGESASPPQVQGPPEAKQIDSLEG